MKYILIIIVIFLSKDLLARNHLKEERTIVETKDFVHYMTFQKRNQAYVFLVFTCEKNIDYLVPINVLVLTAFPENKSTTTIIHYFDGRLPQTTHKPESFTTFGLEKNSFHYFKKIMKKQLITFFEEKRRNELFKKTYKEITPQYY